MVPGSNFMVFFFNRKGDDYTSENCMLFWVKQTKKETLL